MKNKIKEWIEEARDQLDELEYIVDSSEVNEELMDTVESWASDYGDTVDELESIVYNAKNDAEREIEEQVYNKLMKFMSYPGKWETNSLQNKIYFIPETWHKSSIEFYSSESEIYINLIIDAPEAVNIKLVLEMYPTIKVTLEEEELGMRKVVEEVGALIAEYNEELLKDASFYADILQKLYEKYLKNMPEEVKTLGDWYVDSPVENATTYELRLLSNDLPDYEIRYLFDAVHSKIIRRAEVRKDHKCPPDWIAVYGKIHASWIDESLFRGETNKDGFWSQIEINSWRK